MSGLPPTQPNGTAPDEAAETAARPKFSRRPASFSRASAPAPASTVSDVPTFITPEAAPLAPLAPKFKPIVPPERHAWQEDARFGIAMLLIVLLVNVLLVSLLRHLPDRAQDSPVTTIAKAPTMPQQIGEDGSGVTLYSQPEAERQTIEQLDLRNHDGGELSVSPQDIPAPTARALDKDDE